MSGDYIARQGRAGSVVLCAGVVFGDIGTSPLYALQVATKATSPTGTIAPEAILGIVSLVFWALIVIISVKYAVLIMRATNHGEGGGWQDGGKEFSPSCTTMHSGPGPISTYQACK